MRVNYDEMTVFCEGAPSKEALKRYYNLLIDCLINDYGKEVVLRALKEAICCEESNNK